MFMRGDHLSELRRGFSLVEVLVVIVIMGILAGTLSLTLRGSRDRAEASGIISDIRSVKAASLMYRLDSGGFDGTEDISVLAPYADGATMNDRDLSYAFIVTDGRAFLQVDLSRIQEDVRKKIAEMAEGEFYQPKVVSGVIFRELGTRSYCLAGKVLSFWRATPACAGHKGKGNGNGNNDNDHSGNGNDNNGNGNNGNNGNGHGNGDTENDLDEEDPGSEDLTENPQNDSEGSFPVPDESPGGGDDSSNMENDEGSVIGDLQPYAGGEILLLRI
ncbi:MAG: prepilin-type N-terminal cleavage/methylation domain-containing protein [Synergistales bacterium]|nr:prepilin-type N-terminal cleavage/methylation domain-containing protein [Synergistales bacterium]